MATHVVATGDLLERCLSGRWNGSDRALTLSAYRRGHLAQMRTGWGRLLQRTSALLDGDVLLASAEHYDLSAILRGRSIRVCGIGSVWTDPSTGGSDVAYELVEAITGAAAEDGAQMALLWGPYASSRSTETFSTLPVHDLTLAVAEPARYGAPMTMVRGGEERDLEAIVSMGRTRAEGFAFHLDRDVEFLRYVLTTKRLLAGLGAAHARQLHFFIAEEGVTAAAYVVISVVGRTWTLEECGDRDPTGARVGALLQALVAREPAEHRPTIRAWLPPGFLPPQVTIASSDPASTVVRVRMLGTTPDPHLTSGDVLYWRSDIL
jgi:Acetyltransferase (GNAT) domain